LRFTDAALHEIAKQAIKRNTGARGLKTIIENILLDTMFILPDLESVKECVIDEDVILSGKPPLIVYESKAKTA